MDAMLRRRRVTEDVHGVKVPARYDQCVARNVCLLLFYSILFCDADG